MRPVLPGLFSASTAAPLSSCGCAHVCMSVCVRACVCVRGVCCVHVLYVWKYQEFHGVQAPCGAGVVQRGHVTLCGLLVDRYAGLQQGFDRLVAFRPNPPARQRRQPATA